MQAPFHVRGRWTVDGRGAGRAVRVSAHAEGGFLVVSTWKAGICVGTVQLLPGEAAELIGHLSWALAELAPPLTAGSPPQRGRPRRFWRATLARLARRPVVTLPQSAGTDRS